MYLTTRGKPQRTQMQLVKQAVRWYARRLLGNRLNQVVDVELVFTFNDMDGNVHGYCDWNDSSYKARDFTISIRPNLSKKQTLLAIAHEMVHVKQYAKGELYDLTRSRKCKWRGGVVDNFNTSYWDLPWEIEAHELELTLYREFMADMRMRGV